jgi:uncharacterized SAM-binding protein YcdF (DUF218 family)
MMRRKQSRRGRVIVTFCLLFVFAWLIGLFVFVERIPRTPDNANITDAVVVLTGGPGRIDRGVALLAETRAREMLISGVGPDVRRTDLISDSDLSKKTLDCCVTLGRAARDTRENAIEAAGWAASRDISSIRLVTSDFHMPRSLLEFRHRLPHKQILSEPVSTRNIQIEGWWSRPGTALLLAGEYTKYLAIRLQLFVSGLRDRV